MPVLVKERQRKIEVASRGCCSCSPFVTAISAKSVLNLKQRPEAWPQIFFPLSTAPISKPLEEEEEEAFNTVKQPHTDTDFAK